MDGASPLPHPAPEGRTSAASTCGRWGLQTVWEPRRESQVGQSSSFSFGLWDPLLPNLHLPPPDRLRENPQHSAQVPASQFSPKAPHSVAHSGSWTQVAPAHTAPQPPS